MTYCKDESDLISEKVFNHLKDLISDLGVSEYTTTITKGTERGDNYLGIITKAEVNGFNKERGENVTLHFVIKSAPMKGATRQMMPLRDAYNREIYVYNTVLPEMSKLQTERKIKSHFRSYAKFYNSTMADKNEAIVMEDMNAIGFQMSNRREPLNYYQVLFVLREYGKLHALSFALRDQKPDIFEELSQHLQENFLKVMNESPDIKEAIKDLNERALNAFDPVKDEVPYKRFKHFFDSQLENVVAVTEAGAPGKYGVICHGDCWSNNILFKYKDSTANQKPTQICLLDWQLSRVGSPALDLSYFIFTCTDKELRDKYYDHFIEEYYDSLSTFLIELGSDPKILFPFEVLKTHLKKYSLFGLYMATMLLHAMVSDTDEIPDMHGDYKVEELYEKLSYETKNIKKYQSKIRDVVLDFIKYDYDF